jgi:dipeptidyl aminopeptidase/acylaminoacyl peptidase
MGSSSRLLTAMDVTSVSLYSSQRADDLPELRLTATLYLSSPALADKVPGLVVGHGAGSRRSRHDEFCRQACASGFAVLALDFRGHGDSTGSVDGPLELDLVAAAGYLRDLPGVDPRRIYYRGSSMGGFYGLKAAPKAGFAALALLCPAGEDVILDAIGDDEATMAPETDGGTLWDRAALRRYFLKQDSVLLASRVTCPVLLIHARGDSVVPFKHSLRLTESFAGETTLLALPGGTHTTAQHDSSVHHRTIAWLLADSR